MSDDTGSKRSARDRILQAAIDSMREKSGVEEVTIRGIARQAGVGIGLIHYHFRSKERLIAEAVRFFQTKEVLSGWEGQLLFRPKSPVVLIKDMLKSFVDFMADFPRISRISILNDLHSPGMEDNTMQAVKGITPYVQEAQGRNGNGGKAFRTAWTIISVIQSVFLRTTLFTGDGGFDFSVKNERDAFIEDLVDTYIR